MSAVEESTHEALAHRVASASWRLTMLVGSSDTGKSTLALLLAAVSRSTCPDLRVALVDSDMGQSHLGPPSTTGWGLVPPGSGPVHWDDIQEQGLGFVGGTSPYRHLLQTLTATIWCCNQALAVADRVILDTCGLASGPLGLLLKTSKIDALRPDRLVILQQIPGDLADLIAWSRARRGLEVSVLPVSPRIRVRSPQERANYRQKRLEAYFASAKLQTLGVDVPGARALQWATPWSLLAGRAFDGNIIGLALLQHPAMLTLLAPWDTSRAATVMLGDVATDFRGFAVGSVDAHPG